MKLGKTLVALTALTLSLVATSQQCAIAGGGGARNDNLAGLLLIIQTTQSDAERARAFQLLNEQYNPYREPPRPAPPPGPGP